MLITSHLFFTLLLAKLLHIKGGEFLVALLAGVAIDLDHLLINKKWINDTKNFFARKKIVHGINQHSLLQEPLFGITFALFLGIILYIFTDIRWWVVPLFLSLHIFLDALMKFSHYPLKPLNKFHYKGFVPSATKWEFFISSIILLIYIFIF